VFAAAQDQRLRSKLLGVAAIYPLVDLVPDGEAKMATRPDPSVPDFIGNNYSNITRLYLDAVEKPSLTDARLSPTYFATRDSLPSHLLLVGSEHDMLCHEAEAMAIKIAVLTDGVKINTESGWRAPGVQWHKILGQPHAFDAIPAKAPDIEMARVAAMDEMYSVTSEWLTSVFSETIIKR
jgi:acetyl esterase/lipase